MRKLLEAKVSRQMRRTAPALVGYYTMKEAAARLGVDASTLRYRRDTADAKTYWELQGMQTNDPTYKFLAESHRMFRNHHYFEKTNFDTFADLYIQRPAVIRARKRRHTFPKTTPAITYVLTKDEEIGKVTAIMQSLLQSDGHVQIIISTP